MKVIDYSELTKAVREAQAIPIKIYYNQFSGKIIGSCPQNNDMCFNDPFIIVTRKVADKVFKNSSLYIIVFDKKTKSIQPVKKNEIIKLLKPDPGLFQIKKISNLSTENEKADLIITIYRKNLTLTLELNPAIINRSSMPILLSQLQFEEGSALNLFITKKNNPNIMLESVYVDLNDFLSKSKNIKTLAYDISGILQNASIDEISIYTRRIFEDYIWQVKDKFIPTHRAIGVSKPLLLDELKSENYHIVVIIESPNVLTVELITKLEVDVDIILVALLTEVGNPYSLLKAIDIDLTELTNTKRITKRTSYYVDNVQDITWPNKHLNIKFIPYASPYN